MALDPTKANFIDRLIGYLSPERGLDRAIYRSGIKAAYGGISAGRMGTPFGQSESLAGLPHLNLWTHRRLRDRARGECENNTLADSMVEIATDNIIGNGFSFQAQTDDPAWNSTRRGTHERLVSSRRFPRAHLGGTSEDALPLPAARWRLRENAPEKRAGGDRRGRLCFQPLRQADGVPARWRGTG